MHNNALASRQRLKHGRKYLPSVRRSQQPFARPVGVGHHAQHVAPLVEDAGDVAQRTVGIGLCGDLTRRGRIAEGDAVFGFQAVQILGGAEVVAFHVADGHLQHVALFQALGEGAVGRFHAQVDLLADVLEAGIAHQSAGQQSGFGQNLEAVADAQHQSAACGKLLHRTHHRREAGDGPGAQVVAVGKAAGNQHGVDALQVLGVVPEKGDGLMSHFGNHVIGVVVAVGAGKDENPKFHASRLSALPERGCGIRGAAVPEWESQLRPVVDSALAGHNRGDNRATEVPVQTALKIGSGGMDQSNPGQTPGLDSVLHSPLSPSTEIQFTLGPGATILTANRQAAQTMKCPAHELAGVEFPVFFTAPEEARDLYEVALRRGLAQGRFLELRTSDSGVCRLLCRAVRIKGKGERVRVTARNLSRSPSPAISQLDTQDKYRIAFEYAHLGVALADIEGNLFEVNRMMVQTFGFESGQLTSMKICDLAFPSDEALLREFFRAAQLGEQKKSSVEARFLDRRGKQIFVSLSCGMARSDAGIPQYMIVSFRDVTEGKKSQAELEELASYDALTKTLNRARMQERGSLEILRSERHGHKLSLVVIDLDRFKQVNDTYGHAVGDRVLIGFSEVTRNCLRQIDLFGRWGGDEFLLLLPDTGPVGARKMAERVRAALESFNFPQGLSITASLGGVGWRVGESFAALLERADAVMYRAKQAGGNRVEVDCDDLHNDTIRVPDHLPMHPLHWKRSYACGNSSIDGEHRQLFQISNRILTAMNVQDQQQEVLPLVDELVAAVVEHFHHEEALLQAWQYPQFEEHKDCHRGLLEQACDLVARCKRGQTTTGALLGFVIYDVVARHMLQEDFKYLPWIEKSE